MKNSLDKFYTKSEIAEKCINILLQLDFIKKDEIVIEPSAGNGAFIPYIKTLKCKCSFYDILPENDEIILQDFLQIHIKKENGIHIIGNPPFGRQSSLAIKFIKKSCEFADSISFILPKSFKKESMRRHFNSYFHCIHEWNIPKNSFLVNEKEYDVPCVFQVWIKKSEMRESVPKLEPVGFEFVKKNQSPDISFRRVGVNAGTVSTEIKTKSEQSHYFIKCIQQNIVEKIKTLQFDFDNTVGPKSISKQELIQKLNIFF
jgi:hypothetical protein